MAIDLNKMRAKLTALQSRGEKKDSAFWRPEDGEQTIRIVPTADGDPFKEYWFHYNLGKNPGFLSPKRNFGIDDPLNDFVRQLFNDGTEDSIKMAKNLMARQRFFSPVLVRGEEGQGVKIWGYGKMAYEKLLSLVLNPEYGDITDPEEGTDLVIHYGKPAGASFPQTKITPRRKSTPLVEDVQHAETLLQSIPEFNDLFERKTPDQVGQILEEYLAGGTDAEENSVEEKKYGKTSDTNSDVSEVDAAFNDLLGS